LGLKFTSFSNIWFINFLRFVGILYFISTWSHSILWFFANICEFTSSYSNGKLPNAIIKNVAPKAHTSAACLSYLAYFDSGDRKYLVDPKMS